MRASKLFTGLLASFLSVSTANAKIVREGNCDYLIKNDKIVGTLCSHSSAGPALSIPKMNRKIDSMINLESFVRVNNLRQDYGGYKTPILIKAIISVENPQVEPHAISQAGAVGLMQILPSTAGRGEYELRQIETNIFSAMKHLEAIYEKHLQSDGRNALKLSLAEYLVGDGNLGGAMKYHSVKSWKGLEGVVRNGQDLYENGAKLKDSNGTDIINYATRILSNYMKFQELEEATIAKQ